MDSLLYICVFLLYPFNLYIVTCVVCSLGQFVMDSVSFFLIVQGTFCLLTRFVWVMIAGRPNGNRRLRLQLAEWFAGV